MRTLPSNSQAAIEGTGSYVIWILKLELPTGDVYYAEEAITLTIEGTPTALVPAVLNFGSIRAAAAPGQVGGHGDTEIQLYDHAGDLRTNARTTPGLQDARATIWVVLPDLVDPWAGKVKIFAGKIASPVRVDGHTFNLKLKSIEHDYADREIGIPITRGIFPEVACSDCESEILPIAYGNPVRRVRCCVIDRPGTSALRDPLYMIADKLYIQNEAARENFPVDTQIALAVGWPGYAERIVGSFDNPADRREFTIASRGAFRVYAETEIFASGGTQYFSIEKKTMPGYDVQTGTEPPSLLNHLLFVKLTSGQWQIATIGHWQDASPTRVAIVDRDVFPGAANASDCRISELPGLLLTWPAGTRVLELSQWVYAANSLPSKDVDRVEAMGVVDNQNGDKVRVFASYDSAEYTVNKNNKTWNTELGRLAGDPGITTVALDSPPTWHGFDSEQVFITLKGCTEDNDPAGTVIENGAKAIKHFLETEQLGDVAAADIDAASFTAAEGSVENVAFAVADRRTLNEITGDIAYQLQCVLLWDAGVATLKFIDLDDLANASPVKTITDSQRLALSYEYGGAESSSMLAKWSPTGSFDPINLERVSDLAATYPDRRRDFKAWCFQNVEHVSAAADAWLHYHAGITTKINVTGALDLLAITPGDVVKLDFKDGTHPTPATWFDENAIVTSATHQRAQPGGSVESITLELRAQPFAITVTSDTVTDDSCGDLNTGIPDRNTIEYVDAPMDTAQDVDVVVRGDWSDRLSVGQSIELENTQPNDENDGKKVVKNWNYNAGNDTTEIELEVALPSITTGGTVSLLTKLVGFGVQSFPWSGLVPNDTAGMFDAILHKDLDPSNGWKTKPASGIAQIHRPDKNKVLQPAALVSFVSRDQELDLPRGAYLQIMKNADGEFRLVTWTCIASAVWNGSAWGES